MSLGRARRSGRRGGVRPSDHLRTCVRANRLTNHRLQSAMAARIVMDRGATEQVRIHHRGQVHVMLAGTTVAPPQLDEFLMPGNAPLRAADMPTLGWIEADLFAR